MIDLNLYFIRYKVLDNEKITKIQIKRTLFGKIGFHGFQIDSNNFQYI